MYRSNRNYALQALLPLVTLCAITACDDERPADQSAAQKPITGAHDTTGEWLELKDETDPATWLISRSKASGRAVSDQDSDKLKSAIGIAVLRLGESARMIANRSVQLEAMLRAEGHDESAVMLIPLLTEAIGETGQTEGFGAVSQHYYNMRKAGRTSQEAIADLRQRYGPRD